MSKAVILLLACLVSLLGILLSAVRLPGIWLVVAAGVLMGWLSNWQLVGTSALLWIAGLAVLAEILEFAMSAVITRRAGGSRRAALGALIGGFVGLLFLSIPLPVIGSIFGALLGCFLGAALGELSQRGLLGQDSLTHGTRVGIFAAIGFALGTATKVGLAFVMSIILVTATIRSQWPPVPAPPAAPMTNP